MLWLSKVLLYFIVFINIITVSVFVEMGIFDFTF